MNISKDIDKRYHTELEKSNNVMKNDKYCIKLYHLIQYLSER